MKGWMSGGAVGIAALALLTVAMPAEAFLFTGSSLGLSAEVEFTQTGVSGDIVVRLENISANDVLVPIDVLTAVFFSLSGNPTVTRDSAVIGPTSSVLFGVRALLVLAAWWGGNGRMRTGSFLRAGETRPSLAQGSGSTPT